ncbi:MAG: O-antigen ligase family protein, partial [Proteobacteria bacterium]|nr:O-antigen ligase family protein [Pseudomonadota bacterium]
VACILVVTLWLTSTDFQQRIERSASIFNGTKTAINFALADRLPIWQASWNMLQEHPINGVGARGFRKAYSKFSNDDDIWQQQGWVGMHAHHWILEVLAETGIIGMSILIFAIYKLFLFVKSNYHHQYSWAYMLAILSAFLPVTSTYSIFSSFWAICIWFCGIGLIIVSNGKNDKADYD